MKGKTCVDMEALCDQVQEIQGKLNIPKDMINDRLTRPPTWTQVGQWIPPPSLRRGSCWTITSLQREDAVVVILMKFFCSLIIPWLYFEACQVKLDKFIEKLKKNFVKSIKNAAISVLELKIYKYNKQKSNFSTFWNDFFNFLFCFSCPKFVFLSFGCCNLWQD